MNISTTLLSLLLPMSATLYAMNTHEIAENNTQEPKKFSSAAHIQYRDSQKILANAAMQAFSPIAIKYTKVIKEQNDLTERSRGLAEALKKYKGN